jgi:hypothetical protein
MSVDATFNVAAIELADGASHNALPQYLTGHFRPNDSRSRMRIMVGPSAAGDRDCRVLERRK